MVDQDDRVSVVEEVAHAASLGDRSENAEYIYGKKRLREIDRRIRFLVKRLDAAEVVDPESRARDGADQVFFGATVEYATKGGEQRTISIVGIDETDTARGYVSWISPVARALTRSREGDVVSLRTPAGADELEVLEVRYVPLATGERSRATRLARIAAITRAGKAGARAQGTFELTRSRWGSRVFAWLARRQRFIALFVTNVRGPTERLWVAGAPLERAWPVAPIQGNVRLGVAALSYAGRLGVAVHADVAGVRASVAARALSDELVCFAATEGLPPVAA